MSDTSVVVEVELDEPPAQVWRALTEPALRDAWLTQGDPDLACEVLEADPERSIRYGWRDGGAPGGEVIVEIAPAAGGGTRFRLVHSAAGAPVVMLRPRRAPAATAMMKWAA